MQVYVIFDGQQHGPFELDELRRMPVTPHTPIWYAGLPDWTAAGEASATRVLFETPHASASYPDPSQTAPVDDLPEPPYPIEGCDPLPEPPYPIEGEEQSTQGQPAPGQQPYGQQDGQHPYGYPGQQPYGQPVQGQYRRTPNSYMALAILMTIFCCLPFGIVACIKSANVSDCLAAGDYEGAERNSRSALTWVWVSLLGGVAFYIGLFILGMMMGAAASL